MFVWLKKWLFTATFLKSLPRPIVWIILGFVAVVGYEVAYWVLARIEYWYLGHSGPVTLFVLGLNLPYFSALTAATVFLALGTLAVAYTSYRQTRISEAQRRASLWPKLSIRLFNPLQSAPSWENHEVVTQVRHG